MVSEKKIFTLKQVVSSIKKTIDERYKMAYWVKAEMHKLNRFPSGHCFPELVQKEDGKIVAQLSGTIWKTVAERVNKQFLDVVKEPLKEGTNLLMLVKVTYSETYGLSLQIMDIDPNFVLGELQREREETLKRLNKEGILNKNQNLVFPLLPKRIAIISADTSKGLSDFMNVLNYNEFGYVFSTYLFPAALQGDVAPASIQKQLNRIAQAKAYFDIVVIVRGGGGEVSMTCYNNYELCRAIVNFPLPILTGIGHSTNLTVAEMIAYKNGITPTELAEMLIRSFHDFAVPVENAEKVMSRFSTQILEKTSNQLKHTQQLFHTFVTNSFLQQITALSQAVKNMHVLVKNELHIGELKLTEQNRNLVRANEKWREIKTSRLQRESELLLRSAQYLVQDRTHKFQRISEKLAPSFLRLYNTFTEKLNLESRKVELMSPAQVLKRGYSIAQFNGKVISKKNPVKKGDKICIFTHEYAIEADVETSSPTKNETKI